MLWPIDSQNCLPETHFLHILEIFKLNMGQISCNLLKKAFATWQHASLSTTIEFCDNFAQPCTEIKILRYAFRFLFQFFFCLSFFPISYLFVFLSNFWIFSWIFHVPSSPSLWSGYCWKDLFLQRKSSIDDASFAQRWWHQKWNNGQGSSRPVTGGTGVNELNEYDIAKYCLRASRITITQTCWAALH